MENSNINCYIDIKFTIAKHKNIISNTSIAKNILMKKRKKILNLHNLPILYITYLILKNLFIIANIVINYSKNFEINCYKIH